VVLPCFGRPFLLFVGDILIFLLRDFPTAWLFLLPIVVKVLMDKSNDMNCLSFAAGHLFHSKLIQERFPLLVENTTPFPAGIEDVRGVI